VSASGRLHRDSLKVALRNVLWCGAEHSDDHACSGRYRPNMEEPRSGGADVQMLEYPILTRAKEGSVRAHSGRL
jgi:hypothetical protein